MAKFGEIVAYAYRADLYCPDCITAQVFNSSNGLGRYWIKQPAELALDALAAMLHIEREFEATFDSDEFPKVVLYDELHDQYTTELLQGEGITDNPHDPAAFGGIPVSVKTRFYCGRCGVELES